jgi:GDPmannose 4,6-dehydratase
MGIYGFNGTQRWNRQQGWIGHRHHDVAGFQGFSQQAPSRRRRSIETGLEETLYLGNLEAKRDWGHARDYVEGMYRILQADQPGDFVLATGEARSVREFVELAFAEVGRSIEWRGKGVDETGIDRKSGNTVVRIDPTYFRPTEVDLLVGDASKARQKLGWKPKTSVEELVSEMVAGDLAIARREVANGKDPV